MTDPDIKALAKLARLEVSAEELAQLERQIPDILSFVEKIKEAGVADEDKASAARTVMRDDVDPIESGAFTKKILDAAPAREGDRIAVKQVISRKR